ncbi:unnamed protein product [Closterium sp. NIES-54]
MEGFFKKADGAVALFEGMRLLNKDDGIDGSVQECTADVDLTEWPLFDGCDADEDAYRGLANSGGFLGGGVANSYGEPKDVETNFIGLFVVKAVVVVEAGYFNDVVVPVVAEAEGVLRGVRWWSLVDGGIGVCCEGSNGEVLQDLFWEFGDVIRVAGMYCVAGDEQLRKGCCFGPLRGGKSFHRDAMIEPAPSVAPMSPQPPPLVAASSGVGISPHGPTARPGSPEPVPFVGVVVRSSLSGAVGADLLLSASSSIVARLLFGLGPGGTGAVGASSGDTGRPQPYFVPLLQLVLGLPSSTGLNPPLLCPPPDQSQPPLQLASPLPAPSPYTEKTGGITEHREPVSRLASPVHAVHTDRRVPRQRPPPVPGTHHMALRPSSVPQRVPLSSPPVSSLADGPDPESDFVRAANPTVPRLLATIVTDPSFVFAAASALVAELVDFTAACRLDYAASLVAEYKSDCPPSVGGECALSTDVLEVMQEDFECFATAVPHLVSMLIAPEGDPDAPNILTPRSYEEAITGPYSSQWQTAMDTKMASWKSTVTYVDAVPPPGANIGVDFFQTFSPTPKMTTLRVLLHIAAQHDYELHSLDFSTAFLQGSLHEEIWLRCPPGFTGSFPTGTQWSLRRPVYGLRQAPCEWNDTLRTTFAALGFVPSTADPSLFLGTDTSLLPFYVLVYVDDLVFATADTEALALVKLELQKRHTCIDLAPPSDEMVEPSGLYPELVGCLMYLMTCTRPDLPYPFSILARYVAPGRHRPEHWEAAKRVLRYLCSTSGMGLVLGGRGPVFLTVHAYASWVDDLAT